MIAWTRRDSAEEAPRSTADRIRGPANCTRSDDADQAHLLRRRERSDAVTERIECTAHHVEGAVALDRGHEQSDACVVGQRLQPLEVQALDSQAERSQLGQRRSAAQLVVVQGAHQVDEHQGVATGGIDQASRDRGGDGRPGSICDHGERVVVLERAQLARP